MSSPNADPEWRTLKGITAPFQVLVMNPDAERMQLAYDRHCAAGSPVTITRVLTFHGRARRGETADGRTVSFGGLATRMWLIA